MSRTSKIGSNLPATFLHGFTQTAESWMPVVRSLALDVAPTLLDAPGHGSNTDGRKSLTETARDIADAMPEGMLVGYSMGARMALHTALLAPTRVTRLVLISGTGGIDDEQERSQRRRDDENLALRILQIGVPAFIEEWLALPMFSGLSTEASNIPERLRNTAEGLADSLRFAGTGTQSPLWNDMGNLAMPVLIVAGADDHKFVNNAKRMHEQIPTSTLRIVPNAGHTVHLEQPQVFAELLHDFVSSGNSEKQTD